MQKIHTRILEITHTIFTVNATNIAIGEQVRVRKGDGTDLFGKVVSFDKEKVSIQAFGRTNGLATNDTVEFLKQGMLVVVGEKVLGRSFDALGNPRDNGPNIDELREVQMSTFNPCKRVLAQKMVRTNIPMIDLFNTLVRSQKLPIFSEAGEDSDALMMRIANQTDADVVVVALMGARQDDYYRYIENFKKKGTLSKTVVFSHFALDSPSECTLIPDSALKVAEDFSVQGKNVLVLLTDMTAYADALKEIAINLEQIPSNRGYPGSLYSDLAFRYEKAVDIKGSGSITLLAKTTMPGGDVTHPVPDNTGYITEGQLFFHNGQIQVQGSLSRLKQLVIGKHTPEDHQAIMNTTVRFYSDGLQARELFSMGFKLTEWDRKLLKFADLFEKQMMDFNVDIPLEQAIKNGWRMLSNCFEKKEVGIREDLLDKFWVGS